MHDRSFLRVNIMSKRTSGVKLQFIMRYLYINDP